MDVSGMDVASEIRRHEDRFNIHIRDAVVRRTETWYEPCGMYDDYEVYLVDDAGDEWLALVFSCLSDAESMVRDIKEYLEQRQEETC